MSALLIEANQIAATGLAALLNTLWYAGAVVGFTWIIFRCLHRPNAATRYWIWTGVLVFLMALPFLPSVIVRARTTLASRTPTAAMVDPLATVSTPAPGLPRIAPITLTVNGTDRSSRWPLWLLIAWTIAAAWELTRLARGVLSVRRLKGQARPTATGLLPASLRRRVRVLASADIASPVAVGYGHPAILIPPVMLTRLHEGEKRAVLLHELAHLARYDDWMALATHAIGAFLIFHPLSAIVLRQIEREREMACDDFVVTRTGSARNYARILARLHDLRWTTGTRLLAPGFLGRHSTFRDRVESLTRHNRDFSARPSLVSLGVSGLLLIVLLSVGGLVPRWLAIAQTTRPASTPSHANISKSFEVASIRPGNPHNRRSDISILPGGRFRATDLPLIRLILFAYEIRTEQIEGFPSWVKSQRYTIEATPPPRTPNQPVHQRVELDEEMVRSLLRDRFEFRAHRAVKQLPVYELVIGKMGARLKPMNKADFARAHRTYQPTTTDVTSGNGRINALGGTTSLLATILSRTLGRIVIDKTGLTGRYDFTLTWVPWQEATPGMLVNQGNSAGWKPKTSAPSPTGSLGPSIFTAIQQQLGLKLKPAKGPVEVLVIDHIEPPTPN